MLEVGNPGLSVIESRSHFSLWCITSAPLIAGNDIRNMTKVVIIDNPENAFKMLSLRVGYH